MCVVLPQLRRGCERNVITYSSLISACEKAGRWELALDLFSEMHREGCKPNVVTYNSLIAACAQGLPPSLIVYTSISCLLVQFLVCFLFMLLTICLFSCVLPPPAYCCTPCILECFCCLTPALHRPPTPVPLTAHCAPGASLLCCPLPNTPCPLPLLPPNLPPVLKHQLP